MRSNRIHWPLVAALLVAAPVAAAQDPAAIPNGSGGTSSVSLEFQGRLTFLGGDSAFSLASGSIGRLVPPAAIGVRLLDGDLYIGLGVSWDRNRSKACPSGGGGSCITNQDSTLFAITPVITYDVLTRGAAHLYPMLTLSFGTVDNVDDNDFLFGANAGLGLRGDIGDSVSIGTEWGWGMLRTSQSTGGADIALMNHGFFGTVNLSARLGL